MPKGKVIATVFTLMNSYVWKLSRYIRRKVQKSNDDNLIFIKVTTSKP